MAGNKIINRKVKTSSYILPPLTNWWKFISAETICPCEIIAGDENRTILIIVSVIVWVKIWRNKEIAT